MGLECTSECHRIFWFCPHHSQIRSFVLLHPITNQPIAAHAAVLPSLLEVNSLCWISSPNFSDRHSAMNSGQEQTQWFSSCRTFWIWMTASFERGGSIQPLPSLSFMIFIKSLLALWTKVRCYVLYIGESAWKVGPSLSLDIQSLPFCLLDFYSCLESNSSTRSPQGMWDGIPSTPLEEFLYLLWRR